MEAGVVIIPDSAPRGLAGYGIVVSLRNGEVADIINVKFPEWRNFSQENS